MLEISNISKTYDNGVKALQDVSLSIDNGMFGLLGPNGAGKSTLLRTIATLQDADSGNISFDGHDVLSDPQFLRGQLGYLPQEFGVYPKISAWDLLHHFAVLKGITNKRQRDDQVGALLEQVNLIEAKKRAVASFSGGMRQRFGIAQALLADPKLIIVDEPTAGLDPEERNRFHNLLSEIGENIVVLLSTHIVEDVRDLCSRMAILAGGQIIASGLPQDLIDVLSGRVWQKTIAKEQVSDYRADHTVLSSQLYTGKVRLRVLADICPEDGFSAATATLEDVYFNALSTHQVNNGDQG
jgi:ABC-2 type transport system ATP-binding protein